MCTILCKNTCMMVTDTAPEEMAGAGVRECNHEKIKLAVVTILAILDMVYFYVLYIILCI